MKVSSAEFIKSAFKEADWPRDQIPEIAFLGRSNVGKSSLMNSLLGVRGLARTSSTPGRTQSLNFFLINRHFRFVDLPGYGYARAPRAVQAEWSAAAEEYRRIGIFDKALSFLTRAVALDPRDAGTHDLIARLWRDSGRGGEAA